MRLLTRWLRHKSRIPRWLRGTLAVVMGALAILGLVAPSGGAITPPSRTGPLPPSQNGPQKPPFAPGPGDPSKSFPSSPALVAQGKQLFNQACSSCHGLNLRGIAGRGPALLGVGPGPVDFFLSTGGMPLPDPGQQPDIPQKPAFSRPQINALIAYVASFGGPPAPTANPARGDPGTGYHQFTLNCAGCHQVMARGGMFVAAWVPNLLHVNAQQLAEAVRMGPFLMPRFDSHQIDQHQLDSLARYVVYAQHPADLGGWGIYNIGPIPEGMVAWFLGLGALLIVARLIGERNDEGVPAPARLPVPPGPAQPTTPRLPEQEPQSLPEEEAP
ncbi:MAG: c-type cytochrome [Solirubrobacteraceae bacterium]